MVIHTLSDQQKTMSQISGKNKEKYKNNAAQIQTKMLKRRKNMQNYISQLTAPSRSRQKRLSMRTPPRSSSGHCHRPKICWWLPQIMRLIDDSVLKYQSPRCGYPESWRLRMSGWSREWERGTSARRSWRTWQERRWAFYHVFHVNILSCFTISSFYYILL